MKHLQLFWVVLFSAIFFQRGESWGVVRGDGAWPKNDFVYVFSNQLTDSAGFLTPPSLAHMMPKREKKSLIVGGAESFPNFLLSL